MTTPALSSLVGGALGDALGYSREFTPVAEHLAAIPSGDWRDADFDNAPNAATFHGARGKALISDDTQMTIATGRALITAHTATVGKTRNHPQGAANLADSLTREYVAWSVSDDNNRAPGMACMKACNQLRAGMPWRVATDVTSMGCGANMRVAPVAFFRYLDDPNRWKAAMLVAAVTHAHPGALVAAALTEEAIRLVASGRSGAGALSWLLGACESRPLPEYPEFLLGDLWRDSEYTTAAAYLRAGFDVCAGPLRRAQDALRDGWAGDTDPCEITGEGWTAPEALAGALLCTIGLWDTPVDVLRRAAVSGGDSDSLAAIAGNIRGAAGVVWPRELTGRLESAPLRDLRRLAKEL